MKILIKVIWSNRKHYNVRLILSIDNSGAKYSMAPNFGSKNFHNFHNKICDKPSSYAHRSFDSTINRLTSYKCTTAKSEQAWSILYQYVRHIHQCVDGFKIALVVFYLAKLRSPAK